MKDLLYELLVWLKDCPLIRARRRQLKPGQGLEVLTKADVNYWISMAFVEGTTAQDIAAAGAASAAIWVIRCPEVHGLHLIPIQHGRYRVETDVRVRFTPLEDHEAAVPIFNGRKLVEILERTQRQ